MVERSQDEAVVCLGWLKGRCGCVEILGGEDGPFEYEWHWRLWDEISCRSHVMGSKKCRASAAWLSRDGGMGNSIGSGRGRMRSDLPKCGSYRTSAERVRVAVVRSVEWYPGPICHFQGFDVMKPSEKNDAAV
jgi:hypothetical protein